MITADDMESHQTPVSKAMAGSRGAASFKHRRLGGGAPSCASLFCSILLFFSASSHLEDRRNFV